MNGLICHLTNTLLSPVFESFKDYVATEQLDGDNKYDAGEHGLQVRFNCHLVAVIYSQACPLLINSSGQSLSPVFPNLYCNSHKKKRTQVNDVTFL